MPRSLQEILDHADELADRFEAHDPDPERIHDAQSVSITSRHNPQNGLLLPGGDSRFAKLQRKVRAGGPS